MTQMRTKPVPKEDDLVFKALSNPDRRLILDCLREQPQTTGAICEQLGWLNRCTVMLHLSNLEKAELIVSRKQGRVRWNYLNAAPIQQVYRRWIKDYAQPAADMLVAIKDHLENAPER